MTNILQYSPWVRCYIFTERPYEGAERLKKQGEAIRDTIKYLIKRHEEGENTISKEELRRLFRAEQNRKIYDVSKDIISGTVSLRLNAMSSLQMTLANPDGKYLNVFMPNDRIFLFMKRIKPIQVFSGYLDEVPTISARKSQPVKITASCNLKKLNNTFWNANLHIIKSFSNNSLESTGGFIAPDEYLRFLVEDVGGFHPVDVYIQPFKDTEFWNMLVNYSVRGGSVDFSEFSSAGYPGGPSPGGTELTTANIDAGKLSNWLANQSSPMAAGASYFVEAGRKYNVNPALIVAIGGHETSFGKARNACCNNGANFNYWGIKYNSSFASFGAMVGPKSPEGNHYCTFPDIKSAAYTCAYLLAKYLTPGNWRYVDGTIRGISGMWTRGSRIPNESWAKDVENFYRQIMQSCTISSSSSATSQPRRSYTRENEEDLRQFRRSATKQSNFHGFPLNSDVDYHYTNDFGVVHTNPKSPTRLHEGIDIFAPKGTPAFAVCDGVVTFREGRTQGHTVRLTLDDGSWFSYMHMDGYASNISNGQRVSAGTCVGFVGNTGNASTTAPHIHFEQRTPDGKPVNPYPWLISHDPKRGGVGADSSDSSGMFRGTGDPSGLGPYNLQNYMKMATLSAALKGVYQLAVSDRLLKTILEVAAFGNYFITSDGTGRFIARWADFFGTEPDAEGRKGPHYQIEEIEIIDGQIYVSDVPLVTHQFVVPDSAWDGEINIDDWLAAGIMNNSASPTAAVNLSPGVTATSLNYDEIKDMDPTDISSLAFDQNVEFGVAVTAFHSPRLGIMEDSTWTPEEFIERYGYRPAVNNSLICTNKAQAQFMSEYLFKQKWAGLVSGGLTTTFLPEIRPMMIVRIPLFNMQFFVESVTHSFGTRFGTNLSLKAGVFLDDSLGSRNPFLSRLRLNPNYVNATEEGFSSSLSIWGGIISLPVFPNKSGGIKDD